MIPFLPFSRTIRNCLALAIIGVIVIGWSGLSSYARTGAQWASDGLRQQVPTAFEIERLATLVNDLDGTLSKQRARLVTQEVELEYLRREVAAAKNHEQRLQQEVLAARDLLQVERAHYSIGGRSYPRERVEMEARSTAQALIHARSTAQTKAATLATLEAAVTEAEEHLAAAGRQRQTYALRLNELRAQAESVAMRKELVTSIGQLPTAMDQGAFQQVENSFARIERELAVQHRLLAQRNQSPQHGAIPFGSKAERDIHEILQAALQDTCEDSSQSPGLAIRP
ncbi:MAG: hypothetical protein EA402_07370 [Planctomycetota bacterium]|nr:MAG: hypothetical protein EA402_07370 [Planctomycetota bacterium]